VSSFRCPAAHHVTDNFVYYPITDAPYFQTNWKPSHTPAISRTEDIDIPTISLAEDVPTVSLTQDTPTVSLAEDTPTEPFTKIILSKASRFCRFGMFVV